MSRWVAVAADCDFAGIHHVIWSGERVWDGRGGQLVIGS